MQACDYHYTSQLACDEPKYLCTMERPPIMQTREVFIYRARHDLEDRQYALQDVREHIACASVQFDTTGLSPYATCACPHGGHQSCSRWSPAECRCHCHASAASQPAQLNVFQSKHFQFAAALVLTFLLMQQWLRLLQITAERFSTQALSVCWSVGASLINIDAATVETASDHR